ncbi:histidine phosphatase family protein [Pseudenhygromyxa sp. WMMC2535]|uniref:histidine phosphatase family protein n=1 Tax=Pseudenhygromyxa sp. WMMC2535 TaxID=2712867 RepID=UPI001557F922|nr:histidine phosphatase family protein [Pseudenhygromyxa sp. WMMC2535]
MTAPHRPWRGVAERGALALLLIRHGRSTFNAERRFNGAGSDPPLDAQGREQVAALGERLRGEPDRVLCSPQRRALETAAALGATPTVIHDLRELDQGALEGRVIPTALAEHAEFFAAWRRDPAEVRVPGGETMTELAERTHAAISGQLGLPALPSSERRAGAVIAVVGHQMAHAAFTCRVLGQPLKRWPDYQLRNATANLLVWDGHGWSLEGRDL